MKKAILFGNYKDYQYHPLKGVDHEIETILEGYYEVAITEDDDIFNPATLLQTDLLILYGDRWGTVIKSHHMGALLSYVSLGGRLFVLHNGISFQDNFEFMQMVGGKFSYHPDICKLFFYQKGEHPIMDGIPKMELLEEPYIFEFCSHTEKNIFLEYEMNDGRYPAGWSVGYAMGKIVYLMPGHTAETFRNDTYRSMILNAVQWLQDTER